ncbi:EH domain-binding protein 1-like protein 1 [Taeniopygia guttata]|uniref:EH domain-binding protein 1-like protein 1 n=1 Tax=Taeniopygia guttata TaxID=59729 RepID=UPI003BB86453
MGSVWKRLQRAGKRAAKVRFRARLEELLLEGGGGWTPDRVTVVWSRRQRRVCSKPRRWQPGIQNPQRGMVVWVVPETLEVVVTLYRDPQATTFDDKIWNFLVVNESRGRRSVVAAAPLELGRLAGVGDTPVSLSLRPRSRKVTTATLRLRLRGLVLLEGHPTDEDMRSVTSLSPPGDVADLGDFESDPEDEGGAPPAPPAPPPSGDPPNLGTRRDPPEPGGDPETPPEISADPPGGRGALLAWCRGVTAGYRGVAVTDFGGSWSSGLGFCALLHRLRPREIDFEALDPRDPRGNNKRAFDAFAALGVPRLLDPSDMETPDPLGVMTFLSQVRAILGTPPGTPPDPRSDIAEGGPQITPPGTSPEPQISVSEGGPQTAPPNPRSGSSEGGPRETLQDPQNPPETQTRTPPDPQSEVTEGGPQTTPPGTPPEPQISVTEGGAQEPPRDPQTPPETQTETPPDPQISVSEGGLQTAPPDPRSDVTEGGSQITPPGTPPDPQSDVIEGGPQTTPPGTPPDPQIGISEGGPQTTPPGTPPDPQSDVIEGGPQTTPPGTPPEPQISVTEGGPQEPPQDPRTPPETQTGTPPDPQISIRRHRGGAPRDPPSPPPARPHRGGAPPDPPVEGEPPQDPQTDPAQGGPPLNLPRDPQNEAGEGGGSPQPLQDPPPAFGEGAAGPGPPPRPVGVGRGLPTPPPRSRSLPRLRDPPPKGDAAGPPRGDSGSPPCPPPETPREPPEPPEEESGGQWVVAELVALEQDQARLDAQAPALERELRALMDSGADPAREERLLREWFSLVQRRNLLVRRQDELQLLAQERDLERRFELLSRELRGLLGTEEWQKPPAQRQREQLLLEELVALVNRRDRLVRDRHRRESRAQEEDEELRRSLELRRRRCGRRETCGIC